MSPSSKSPTPSELSAALLHRQFGYPPKPSAKWVVFRRAPQTAGMKSAKATKLLEDKILPAEVSINEQPSVASTSNECMEDTLLPRKGDDVLEAIARVKYVPKEQLLSGTEQVTEELDTGLSELTSPEQLREEDTRGTKIATTPHIPYPQKVQYISSPKSGIVDMPYKSNHQQETTLPQSLPASPPYPEETTTRSLSSLAGITVNQASHADHTNPLDQYLLASSNGTGTRNVADITTHATGNMALSEKKKVVGLKKKEVKASPSTGMFGGNPRWMFSNGGHSLRRKRRKTMVSLNLEDIDEVTAVHHTSPQTNSSYAQLARERSVWQYLNNCLAILEEDRGLGGAFASFYGGGEQGAIAPCESERLVAAEGYIPYESPRAQHRGGESTPPRPGTNCGAATSHSQEKSGSVEGDNTEEIVGVSEIEQEEENEEENEEDGVEVFRVIPVTQRMAHYRPHDSMETRHRPDRLAQAGTLPPRHHGRTAPPRPPRSPELAQHMGYVPGLSSNNGTPSTQTPQGYMAGIDTAIEALRMQGTAHALQPTATSVSPFLRALYHQQQEAEELRAAQQGSAAAGGKAKHQRPGRKDSEGRNSSQRFWAKMKSDGRGGRGCGICDIIRYGLKAAAKCFKRSRTEE